MSFQLWRCEPFRTGVGAVGRLPCVGLSDEVLMPMKLEGSCRCAAARFSVESHAPYPYQLCYCSICRKTAGGGGFAINLSADCKSLKVRGRKAIGIFRAK